MSTIKSPLTYIINNLYKYSYEKSDLIKILASIRRVSKELRDYINNELDRTKYTDPIFNTLWRHLNKKCIIYTTFKDYNFYMSKKKTNYTDIYIEGVTEAREYDSIILNKYILEKKNIKHIFNIYFYNCKIDIPFCGTRKIKYKYVNLYLINCKFTIRCNLINKCSYGTISIINCKNFPRLFLDNQDSVYIYKSSYIDTYILNDNYFYNSSTPVIYISRCNKLYISKSYIGYSNSRKQINIIYVSKCSNIDYINITNNYFYMIDKTVNTSADIVLIQNNSICNPFKNINNNIGLFVKYDNVRFDVSLINLILRTIKNKTRYKTKFNTIVLNNYIPKNIGNVEYIYSENKFKILCNTYSYLHINNLEIIINNIINKIKDKIKKDIQILKDKEIEKNKEYLLNNLNKYINPEMLYKSSTLSDKQLFAFFFINQRKI